MNTSTRRPEPYFFLAYAHTPEQLWVERLYRDLCVEVVERTAVDFTAEVGFMDRSAIPLGSDWREEVVTALGNCRVFVPLYSPRYFTREECGKEWHAFAQRVLEHRARTSDNPSLIVPALWTPVDPEDLPECASRIQMNHADLGADYAREGFYTLIKNSLYKEQYTTAVQRLAKHIIRAASTVDLTPFQMRDFGTLRNAFAMSGRRAPGDRRLRVVVAAPTLDRLPPGRSGMYYGESVRDWNPYFPQTRQAIADFAADVARLSSYEPTFMPFDEGCDVLGRADPAEGLGLLLIDAWAGLDAALCQRLRELDALDLGWVGKVIPWNSRDVETTARADELRGCLREAIPNWFAAPRPLATANPYRITTLEQFRRQIPDVLDGALFRYLNHVEAHPPDGVIRPRPRLSDRPDLTDRARQTGSTP